MTQTIKHIIAKEKEDLNAEIKKIDSNRININIRNSDFKILFLIQLNKIIASRNINRKFEITNENKDVINQIYYYCVGNESKFNGDINKGIMLAGKNGVGKTIILQAYCNMVAMLTQKRITIVHAKKVQEVIEIKGIDYYEKRPLFIDDLGKESKEVNTYGTKSQPIADLISMRYDLGLLTFATCNYKLNTLSEFYGITTTDRMKEMFNIIEMRGDSLRR